MRANRQTSVAVALERESRAAGMGPEWSEMRLCDWLMWRATGAILRWAVCP
jgi:hypothetical protein